VARTVPCKVIEECFEKFEERILAEKTKLAGLFSIGVAKSPARRVGEAEKAIPQAEHLVREVGGFVKEAGASELVLPLRKRVVELELVIERVKERERRFIELHGELSRS